MQASPSHSGEGLDAAISGTFNDLAPGLPPCGLPIPWDGVPPPTESYWLGDNPLEGWDDAERGADEGEVEDEEVDVVIVGSGMTGISVAWHLIEQWGRAADPNLTSGTAEAGTHSKVSPLKVLILEARQFCSGATGRNGGHLTSASFLGYSSAVDRVGEDDASRMIWLEERTVDRVIGLSEERGWLEGDVVGGYDIGGLDLVKGGSVVAFVDEAELGSARRDWEVWNSHRGPPGGLFETMRGKIEWWDSGEEVEKACGFKNSLGGIKAPGNNIYPLRFVSRMFLDLYERSKSPGSNFRIGLSTRTPVIGIRNISPSDHPSPTPSSSGRGAGGTGASPHLSPPRIRYEVTTSDTKSRRNPNRIRTRTIVHATNAYVSHLLPRLASKVVPTRGQVVAIRPPPPDRPVPVTVTAVPVPIPSRRRRCGEGEDDDDDDAGSDGSRPWMTSGFSFNGGYEYFFQRPFGSKPFSVPTQTHSSVVVDPSTPSDNPIKPNPVPPIQTSGRSRSQPLIIFGGGREVSSGFGYGTIDDSGVDPRAGGLLRTSLGERFGWGWGSGSGSGSEGEVESEWTGIMAFTPTHDPIVGSVFEGGVKVPGQYLSVGYSGHGMPRAFGCAEYLADLILSDLRHGGSAGGSPPPPPPIPDWFPRNYLSNASSFGP